VNWFAELYEFGMFLCFWGSRFGPFGRIIIISSHYMNNDNIFSN
jgi:hypothetical protein